MRISKELYAYNINGTLNKTQTIKNVVSHNPKVSARQLADKVKADISLVYWARKDLGIANPRAMQHTKLPTRIPMVDILKTEKTLDEAYDNAHKDLTYDDMEYSPHVTKIRELPIRTAVENDPVNHPSHYTVGGIETIDFIEAKGLNYNLGNVVKYLTRSEHKGNKKQDLQKALWYLNREIQNTK